MHFFKNLAAFSTILLISHSVAFASTNQFPHKMFTAPASVYSSTKPEDCKEQQNELAEEHGASLYSCPSFGEYQIDVIRWERDMLNFVYQDKTLFGYHGTALGSTLAEKIEWRYHQNGQHKQYHALLFRIYIPKIDQNGMISNLPPTQELIVARLNKEKSCIIGIIPQGKNMNEQARELADHKNAACMDE